MDVLSLHVYLCAASASVGDGEVAPSPFECSFLVSRHAPHRLLFPFLLPAAPGLLVGPPGVTRILDMRHMRAAKAGVLFDLGMGLGKLLFQAFFQ